MAKHVAKHVAKRKTRNARGAQFLIGLAMAAGFVATSLTFTRVSTGVVDVIDADASSQSLPVLHPAPASPSAPAAPSTPDRQSTPDSQSTPAPQSAPLLPPNPATGPPEPPAPPEARTPMSVVPAPEPASAPSRAPNSAAAYVSPELGKSGTVTKTATLPDIPLGAFQDAVLPGSIADDRGVKLGSLGSGVFPIGGDEYWTVTDRGPNIEVVDDVHTFPVPDFDPMLVHIKVEGTTVRVVEAVPITAPDGSPVTGMPNRNADDESTALAADAKTVLPHDINGLDPEGLVRTADGHFWISDEYAPSLVELDAQGHVLTRHVPSGLESVYEDDGVAYPVDGALPAALQNRKANRGLEDLALLPDGHTVVAGLQSSLVVPGDKDRIITELLTFDTTTGKTLHEFPYQFDDPTTFGDRGRKLKISALIPVDQDHVVVQERTDTQSRFYLVKLDPADDLIAGADKQLVVNLAGVPGVPDKIESAWFKSPDALVVADDNDFGMVPRAYADGEKVQDSGARTQIVEIKLG